MIDNNIALEILQKTINGHLVHKHYNRVCKLAEDYTILITGENHEKLLQQFIRREDDALFAQRVLLTKTITPAVASSVMNFFYRTGRLDNIKKTIDFDDAIEGKEDKIKDLEESISTYYGAESLDKYLQTRFVQLSFTDPNAFIITTFDAFDSNREKAKPYPFEVSSEEAINFEYKNNILQWLIVKYPILYLDREGKTKDGFAYTMYLGDWILKYTQVDPKTVINAPAAIVDSTGMLRNFEVFDGYYLTEDKRAYQLSIFNPKAGEVQAARIGYKMDMVTKGQTYVNPFHDAYGYFMKTVKAVSEMDLTMTFHAFPQKSAYVDSCPGEDPEHNLTCNKGTTPEGTTCRVCKGSGLKIHTSAQDAIVYPLPKHSDEIRDLSKLVVYHHPPVELLKFQDQYIKDLKTDVHKTVFNSDSTEKPQVANTATQVIDNKDEMYNTLFPFAENYSTFWKTTVRLVAAFRDIRKGLLLQYNFPKDFRLKSMGEMYVELKQAKEAQSNDFDIQEINREIAKKRYADEPRAYHKYLVKERFMPFLGKTPDEVKFILSSGMARKIDQVLYTHSDSIIDDLEYEFEEKNIDFFELPYKKQWEEIKRKAEEIIAELPKETIAVDFREGIIRGEEKQTA